LTQLDPHQSRLLRLQDDWINHPEVTGMSQQWRSISEEQLSRMVGQGTYDSGASVAPERVLKMKKTGHKPAIFYDKLNGFVVLGEGRSEIEQAHRRTAEACATRRRCPSASAPA